MFFKKLSRKQRAYLNLILGAVLVVLIPLGLASLRRPSTAQASWYNDSWAYRQTVALTNSGSAQTDFQVSITLDTATLITAGKMQSDCDDIRVTDDAGKLLKYWIETGNNACNTSTTAIWIKVPSINTTGNAVFVYYGNSSAISQQDGNAVFAFFDDFSGSSIDSTKWTSSTTGTASIAVTGGTVELSSNLGQAGLTGKVNITNNFILEKRIKYVDSPALDRNRFGPGSTPGQDHGIFWRSTNIQVYWNGAWSGTVVTASQYYRDKRTHDGSTFTWTITTDAGAAFYSNSISNTLSSPQYPSMITGDSPTVAGGDMFIDWIFARKYAATLPTVASPTNEEKAPGPVAYWKFDDGTGTTAQDSTQQNNDGTISGATWQTEDQCISGKCLSFDGSSDYVNQSSLSGAAFSSGAISVSGWIKANTIPTGANDAVIVDIAGSSTSERIYVAIQTGANSGKLTCSGYDGTVRGIYNTGPTLSANTWYHFNCVLDSSGNYTLYLNGISKTTASSTNVSASNPAFSVGSLTSAAGGPGRYFTGQIDDIKIYPYARTASQIQTDYASRGSVKGTSTILGSDPQNNSAALSNGLAGYWKMDEASGTRSDSSGNGNTLTDNATVTSNPGKFGNAGQFTRANSEYLSIADNTGLSTGDIDFTVSGWVYLDSAPTANSYMNIMSKWESGQLEYELGWANDASNTRRFFFQVSSDGSTGAASAVANSFGATSTGTWYFVAAWHDSVNNTINIQVNNGTVDSTSYSGGVRDGTAPFKIGLTTTNSHFWDGRIDDVRFYKRVLSPADRTSLYNFAPGPISYWNFDENSGASVNDRSGNGYTASWNGTGSHWTQGKYGSAGKFNGSDDYTGTSSSVSFKSSVITLSFWAIANTSTDAVILESSTNFNNNDKAFIANTNSSGQLAFAIQDGTTANLYRDERITRPTDGKWHHYGVVYDNSTTAGDIKVYQDGVLQSTTLQVNTKDQSGNFADFAVYTGARSGGSVPFTGQLDDVKIYSYERNQQQITQDMNAGHPPPGSPVGSAIGHWKFDEGADNTCSGGTNDACNSGSGGSTYDGAQSGLATPATATSGWTQSGKFGKALSFDGTNDSISMGNLGTVPNAGTISFWMKFPAIADYPNAINIVNSATNNNIRFELCSTVANCSGYQFAVTIGNASTQVSHKIATTLSTNTWYYVSATWNQTTNNVTTYLNGQQIVSESHTAWPTNSMSSFTVGAGFGTRYWSGQIDEVKLYNYDLTADQVKLDMNKGQTQVMGALSDNSSYQLNAANQEYCVPGDTTSCTAPVGRWDFDENTGNNVYDKSGTANTGTWNGTLGNQWKPGKNGGGGNFNGSNNYVNVTDSSTLDFGTGNYTLSAWINAANANQYGPVITKREGSGTFKQYNFGVGYISAGTPTAAKTIYMFMYDGTTMQSYHTSNNIVDGNWHHIVGVRTSGVLSIYVDGVNQTLTADTAGTTALNADSAAPLQIGAENGSNYFTGKIDQVRVYNYARTASQIAWDYNRGAPVGHWKFDECQGTIANDSSGNSNTGTITVGASGTQTAVGTCTGSANTMWKDGATGKYNSSLDFDGTDDYVSTGSVGNYTTSPFTISYWVKLNSLTTNAVGQGPVNIYKGDYQVKGYYDQINTSGGVSFVTNQSGANQTSSTATGIINTGTWYNIIYVRNGTSVRIYVNGVDRTNGVGTHTDPTTSTDNFQIGRYQPNADIYTNGQIDDVRVYNYALTATQVKTLYTGGAIRFGPVTGAP